MNVSGGFSLMELIVVLAVLAIGAGVAVPVVLERDEDGPTAAAEILDMLDRARLSAIRCSCLTRVQIKAATGEWFVTEFPPEHPKRMTAGRTDPEVRIQETGDPGKAWIRLELGAFGRPRSLPPDLRLISEDRSFRIVISPNSGVASVEVP